MVKVKQLLSLYWKVYKHEIVCISLILFVVLIGVYEGCRSAKKEHQEQQQTKVESFSKAPIDSTTAKFWKDKYNVEHTQLTQTTAELGEKYFYIDSLAKALKLKPKQIESVTVAKGETVIKEKLTVVTKIDTVKTKDTSIYFSNSYSFMWNDNYTSVIGTVASENGDSIEVRNVDTVTAVNYWKRNKVLGMRIGYKQQYLDIQNRNPHTSIVGGKSLKLEQPKHHYSMIIGGGASYPVNLPIQLNKPMYSFGIFIGRSIMRF